MKRNTWASLVALLALGAGDLANSQPSVDACGRTEVEKVEGPGEWRPGPGGDQRPIWPDTVAVQPPPTDGNPEWVGSGSPLIAGRTWNWATYVSRPTITVYAPAHRTSRAAMLVLPGGGYAAVAMDLEGTEICDWVVAQGMLCAILKYRTPSVWRRAENGVRRPPEVQLPLQDAQRAMSLLRHGAATYGIDAQKIGVIGFSAGAHLAAALSNERQRTYASLDAADEAAPRPNFAILAYPGRLWDETSPRAGLQLAPWVEINADAPPTLLIHAMNDPTNNVRHSMAYGLALKDAGVPVDMRFFARGCHAFGLRPTSDPVTTEWPGLAVSWLRSLRVL